MVSFVIPAWNEEAVLGQTLLALKEANAPPKRNKSPFALMAQALERSVIGDASIASSET
jgi:hypothetical protein